MCVDEIIAELAYKYDNNIIAYIDDVIIGLKDQDDLQEVIAEADKLYSTIGLKLNSSKSKCTRNEEVDFMGVTYH